MRANPCGRRQMTRVGERCSARGRPGRAGRGCRGYRPGMAPRGLTRRWLLGRPAMRSVTSDCASAPSEGVKESAGRRNRLPHPPPSGLAAMWGRQCCLPSAVFDRFFHTFSRSRLRCTFRSRARQRAVWNLTQASMTLCIAVQLRSLLRCGLEQAHLVEKRQVLVLPYPLLTAMIR